MLQQTIDHLEAHGFIRDDKLWRNGLIERLRTELTAQPLDTFDEIQEKARTVTELQFAILGEHENEDVVREIDQLLGTLVAASPNGPVQKSLENGYVLCKASVLRTLVEGEAPKKKNARFVSSDPDMVEQFFNAHLADRAVKAAGRANEGFEVAGRRIPLLASRRPMLVQKAQEQLALALPLDAS